MNERHENNKLGSERLGIESTFMTRSKSEVYEHSKAVPAHPSHKMRVGDGAKPSELEKIKINYGKRPAFEGAAGAIFASGPNFDTGFGNLDYGRIFMVTVG